MGNDLYNKTKVINLFGGPGAGKSTMAAFIFGLLKSAGIDTELVTEYAKDKVWEGSGHVLDNQTYVLGKQLHRLWRLQGKVQVAITDSPIILSSLYNDKLKNIDPLVSELHESFDTQNYLLERRTRYNHNGRNQTEEEARELDYKLLKLLNVFGIEYNVKEGSIESACRIAEEIYFHIKGKRMKANISIELEE